MRFIATEFGLKSYFGKAELIAQLKAWLNGTNYSKVLRQDALTEEGRDSFTFRDEDSGETLRIRSVDEGEGEEVVGFLHEYPDGDLTWQTECVLRGRSTDRPGVLRIRTQCLARKGAARTHIPQRPYIIKNLLMDGVFEQDGAFSIEDTPHELGREDDDIKLAASIFMGSATSYLPVVYISASATGDWPLEDHRIKRLARELGGLAHVVVEPSREFSFRLKEESDGHNAYGGAIGLCAPGHGLVRRYFIGGLLRDETLLFEKVKERATQLRSELPADSGWDWHQLLEIWARRAREREKGSLRIEDWEELHTDELEAKNNRIAELEAELQEKQALSAEFSRSVGDGMAGDGLLEPGLVSQIGREIYENEFSDRVRAAIVEVCAGGKDRGWDGRSLAVFGRVLEVSEFSGRADTISSELSKATRDRNRFAKAVGGVLKELGYAMVADKTHLKYNPKADLVGLSPITIAKTPSDTRGQKNAKSQIEKALGLTRLK